MIIRRKHTANFTTIGNVLFNDERLKADEVGIIGYLLSRPNDWEVRRPQLAKRFDYGREAIKRVIWNGMRFGWIVAQRTQQSDGRFRVVYEIKDQPGPELSDEEIRRALSLSSSEAAEDQESDVEGADEAGAKGDPPPSGNHPPPTGDPATGQPGAGQPATGNPYVVSIEESTKDGFSKGDGGGRARGSISPEAWALAEEIATIAGYPTKLDWPPGWCGSPQRVETWLAAGWQREISLAVTRAVMVSKTDGPPDSIKYFEKAIAREIARQSAPLPTTEQSNVQTDRHSGARNGGKPRSQGHAFAGLSARLRSGQAAGTD